MKTKTEFKKYRLQTKTGEIEIIGVDVFAALSKYLKRGVNGLGAGWTFTRQPDGWIVASDRSRKVLEGKYFKLKEVGWTRGSDVRL
jgi:hypothetical protein